MLGEVPRGKERMMDGESGVLTWLLIFSLFVSFAGRADGWMDG